MSRGIFTTLVSFEEIQFWFFFCVADGSAVKTEVFTRQLKGALAFCDLDCFSYKSHSFRISAASLAAENGMSDAQIWGLGRWKSDGFKLYIRSPTAWAN